MGNSVILGLIQNVAILLTVTLLYDYIWISRKREKWLEIKIINGIIIGGLGVLVMLTPWTYVPGIIFDTRTIILSISGLFFGLAPTLIAIVVTGVYRIIEGGDGMWMGIAIIVSSGLIGVLWKALRPRWQNGKYALELILMGVLVHIVFLICSVFLPREMIVATLKTIALPVIIIYPLGTFLIGLLMLNRTRLWNAKKELKESEERWHFALEGAGDGLWDWDVQSNEVFLSRQWKMMLGYEENEIENLVEEWDKRLHPDDRDRVYKDLNRHLAGEIPVYMNEQRLLCKDGSYKWILARGKVVSRAQEGKPIRIIGIHSDITERKKAEEEIINLSKIVEESLNEIYVFDAQTLKFTYVNKVALANLGYSYKEMREMTPINLKPEYTLDEFKELVNPLLKGKKRIVTFATIHKRKDNSTYFTEVYLQLHNFSNKKEFVAIVLDVTESKIANDKIKKLNEELEQKVKERTSELEMKIAEIEQMNRLFIGREFRIKELKDKVKELESRQPGK